MFGLRAPCGVQPQATCAFWPANCNTASISRPVAATSARWLHSGLSSSMSPMAKGKEPEWRQGEALTGKAGTTVGAGIGGAPPVVLRGAKKR
jgi:hypothetical protein